MNTYVQPHSEIPTRTNIPCQSAIVGTKSFIYTPGGSNDWPDESRAEMYKALGHFNNFTGIFIIDIEHLDMTDPTSIEHVKFAIQMYRVRFPDLLIGLYMILPERAYWPCVLWKTDAHWKNEREKWQARNAALRAGFRALSRMVDFVVPSIYALYADQMSRWAIYASDNLVEAAKYGLPVIPALWAFAGQDTTPKTYVGDRWAKSMYKFVLGHHTKPEGVFLWQEAAHPEPDSFYETFRGII